MKKDFPLSDETRRRSRGRCFFVSWFVGDRNKVEQGHGERAGRKGRAFPAERAWATVLSLEQKLIL